jgi:hypothetical protein
MIYDIEIVITYQFTESLTSIGKVLILFPFRLDNQDDRMLGN